MEEKWLDIKGYEGLYQVSNMGNVFSVARLGTKGGEIKTIIVNGYKKVKLYKNGKMKTFSIHKLVAQAFIPNPENKPQVNHIDGNKSNNFYTNLEWVSCQENVEHAYINGLRKTKAVLQIKDGKVVGRYLNVYRASVQTGIQYTSIYWCCAGIYSQAGGYQWRYE